MRDTTSQCSVMCTVRGLVVRSIRDGREQMVQNVIVTVQKLFQNRLHKPKISKNHQKVWQKAYNVGSEHQNVLYYSVYTYASSLLTTLADSECL